MITLYKWMELIRLRYVDQEAKIAALTKAKIIESPEIQELVDKLARSLVEESCELQDLVEETESYERTMFKKLVKLLKSIDCSELLEIKQYGDQSKDFQDMLDRIIEVKKGQIQS